MKIVFKLRVEALLTAHRLGILGEVIFSSSFLEVFIGKGPM